LLVSAVIADARNFQILAVAKVSPPALGTRAVLAAVPANTDALPPLPLGNAGTHFVDDAHDLVSWNAGILDSGPISFHGQHVTVANTTRLDLDPHVPRTRRRNLALDDLETCSRFRNLGYFHGC
jgi:hypothetical protein